MTTPSVPRLTVKRGEYTIRETSEKTVWYYSTAPMYLLEPPATPKTLVGNLYVHTAANDDRQIWLYTSAARWEKVQRRHRHPYLNGYVLHLLSNGEPRWVKRETVVKYDAEAKKRGQAARPPCVTGESCSATLHVDMDRSLVISLTLADSAYVENALLPSTIAIEPHDDALSHI